MNKDTKINPNQDEFCRLYALLGNATKAYSIAYNIDIPLLEDGKMDNKSTQYRSCAVSSSKMLTIEKIYNRYQFYLVERLNDKSIDARLSDILYNGQESNSIQAIKIANDLKQRITKKIDITTAGRPLANLSDEELKALAG